MGVRSTTGQLALMVNARTSFVLLLDLPVFCVRKSVSHITQAGVLRQLFNSAKLRSHSGRFYPRRIGVKCVYFFGRGRCRLTFSASAS